MRWLSLVLVVGLAGCGAYPQPFAGNPGATARRLAQPPPVRLAVPPPANAMLDDAAAELLAHQVAAALADADIPAVAGPSQAGDWVLTITTTLQGNKVTPVFTITNPKGALEGTTRGAAVAAAAWSTGAPPVLAATAHAAVPDLSDQLTSIQARIAQSDPNSLLNRSAHIYFSGVTGAPGNGNQELTTQMRTELPKVGELVQAVPDNADISLRGEVHVGEGANKTQRIEIQWIVNDARGERGRVVQLNEVPPGSLNGYWGDVAAIIAQQGAAGVKGVIESSAGKARQATSAQAGRQASESGAPPLDPAKRALPPGPPPIAIP